MTGPRRFPAAYLWALDAGTRHAGLALVHGGTGELLDAHALTTNRAHVGDMLDEIASVLRCGPALVECALVSEWPRKYKANPRAHDDIDGLRAVVAGVEGLGLWSATRRVTPGVWKGHVPKHIHHARVSERLTPAERRAVCWDELGLDGRDAAALALWTWGEGRTRVRL